MLVNVKYAIPGQVRPIISSGARECVLFWTEIPQDPDEPPDAVPDGAGHVFLNCPTFELYTYDGARAKRAHTADTVEEIMLLVAAAPTPEGVPMLKLEPDAEGEAALQRILDRDPSIFPLLESDFLGHGGTFTQAIRNIEAYVAQMEEELAADKVELADLRAVGSPELLEREGLDRDEEAHAKMRVHLEDAKEKLKALRKADGIVWALVFVGSTTTFN
ncbi:hypothetical protein B0H13DRAFT_2011230 [Mycena leptocephala]|nr:hypothetical protein B0H13DRAFT_2011230 [Mycena leptocephala]